MHTFLQMTTPVPQDANRPSLAPPKNARKYTKTNVQQLSECQLLDVFLTFIKLEGLTAHAPSGTAEDPASWYQSVAQKTANITENIKAHDDLIRDRIFQHECKPINDFRFAKSDRTVHDNVHYLPVGWQIASELTEYLTDNTTIVFSNNPKEF